MKESLKNILGVTFMVISTSVLTYTFNELVKQKIRVDWVNSMADKNNNGYLEPSEKSELFKICGHVDKPTNLPITSEEYEIAEKYYHNKYKNN